MFITFKGIAPYFLWNLFQMVDVNATAGDFHCLTFGFAWELMNWKIRIVWVHYVMGNPLSWHNWDFFNAVLQHLKRVLNIRTRCDRYCKASLWCHHLSVVLLACHFTMWRRLLGVWLKLEMYWSNLYLAILIYSYV